MPDPAPAAPAEQVSVAPRRGQVLRALGLLALSLICARVVLDLVGRVDWQAVRSAFAHVALWQLVVLALLLVVRQVLNASPLVWFIEGLSLFRATLSDQAATLISMVTPPPSDMVLRISIYRSWGIEPARGLAGATANTLVFYANRFLAPALGFLLLLTVRFEASYAVAAAVGALVSVTIAVLVGLAVRDAAFATAIGERAGRTAAVVRRSVDPEEWGRATLEFRGHLSSRLRRGVPRSLAALVAMVVLDGCMLLLAIRFVGVGPGRLPAVEVLAAFLVLFPLTLFPLGGLGILDATLVAAMTEVGGDAVEAPVIAALVAWRAVTLVGPMVLGAFALGLWRRSVAGSRQRADPDRA